MALYNFWNGVDLFHNIAIHRAAFKVQSNISTGSIAEAFGVYVEPTAHNYAVLNKVLHTLMNGCARYSTLCCYVFKWDTSI